MEETVKSKPMSTNNQISILITLCIMSFFSCEIHKKNNVVQSIEYKIENNKIEDRVSVTGFIPDTSVNDVMFLEQYFVPQIYGVDSFIKIEGVRENYVVAFCNNKKDKYLLTYFYEGGAENTFSAFEIGYIKDDIAILQQQPYHTNNIDFLTESVIHLGLTLDEVINIKGTPQNRYIEQGFTIMSYYISDNEKSDFLNRYKMPSYLYRFWFKDNKLVKFLFGFNYP